MRWSRSRIVALSALWVLGCRSGAEGPATTRTDAGSPGRDAAIDASLADARIVDSSATRHDGSIDDAAREPHPALVTVQGRLEVSPFIAVDSDTADLARAVTRNDAIATAEPVPDHSVVAGYLGAIPGGTDAIDVYRVDLSSGDSVVLTFEPSGGSTPDFDLELDDGSGKLVEDSLGTGSAETVFARSNGAHYLKVSAATGVAGRYLLAIGKSNTVSAASARDRLSTASDFVPGEALVKLRDGASSVESEAARLGVHVSSRLPRRERSLRVALSPRAPLVRGSGAHGGHDRRTTIDAIKALRRSPDVLWAEPNYVRHVQAAAPNDPLFSSQWNFATVNALSAWDHVEGEGTIVAIVDTGIKASHPDWLNADSSTQLLPGYDMIEDPQIAADGDGRDANPDDAGDQALAGDSSFHGTHVAGIVAAATGNGLGCAGIAPKAKILPVRALGIGGGTTNDIVQSILYAAGLPNDAGVLPARRADVINLSFSGPGLSQATAEAVAAARSVGVIVVAAAGNDSMDAATYSPAAEPGVVTVGAVDLKERLAHYSNFGTTIDVVAPGGDVTQDLDGNGLNDGVLSLSYGKQGTELYVPREGTSMAAAHVSAIAALVKAAYPSLTPDVFDGLLSGSFGGGVTVDLGPAGVDDIYGNGLLDANLAVNAAAALDAAPPPAVPTLAVSSTTLDFGSSLTALPLSIRNRGAGTLTVQRVTASATWIAVSPGALGDNVVTVDRSAVGAGEQTGNVEIESNGGAATILIRATVLPSVPTTGGDVGTLHVRLVDSTGHVAKESRATAADGYAFDLSAEGDTPYTLVAGTDLDGDGVLDEDGEAYGAYPSTAAPVLVSGQTDAASLTFAVRLKSSTP